jgi:hypothetical protein
MHNRLIEFYLAYVPVTRENALRGFVARQKRKIVDAAHGSPRTAA